MIVFRLSPNALTISLYMKKRPYAPNRLNVVMKLNKEGNFRCRKYSIRKIQISKTCPKYSEILRSMPPT